PLVRDIPAELLGIANWRKRTYALEACTKGRVTVRHLKPEQTNLSGLPARSKKETDKESRKEGKSELASKDGLRYKPGDDSMADTN
ncbi:8551_t:CDS:2, partial [Cetraspora pellucida]